MRATHRPRSAARHPRKQISARAAITLAPALAALLVAAVPAAAPPGESPTLELEEIQVTSKVPRPLEDYVEFPRYDSVTISPGGTRLVTGWTEDNFYRQLSFVDFPSMKPHNTRVLQQFLGVSDVRWASEDRVVVQPDWPLHGFLRIRESLRSILVTDVEGRSLRELNATPPSFLEPIDQLHRDEAVASGPRQLNTGRSDHPDNGKEPDRHALGPVRLVEARTDTPGQLLFHTTRTDRDGNTDGYGAFALDIASGRQSRLAVLPLPEARVITGPAHQVALAWGSNARNESLVYYLPPEARAKGRDWQLRVRVASGDRGLVPVAWTGNAEEYYALEGRNQQTRSVVIWNADDDTEQLLYRHVDADIEQASLDPAGRPWMFSGMGHFPVYWYPQPDHPLAKLHQALVRQLPREQVDITSATDDLSFAVVRVSSGARATLYFVMDVKAVKSVNGMNTYPKLKGTRLAPVDAIEFRARDGLLVRGYLTTPLDGAGKPRRQLPLVLVAHDGPGDAPSDFRYEFERQLLASRGFAVLQVNHRGAGGRGRGFERLADGQWGMAVQDDYADAVRWALKDGVAAPGRTCFYGTGLGAYSAILTASRSPDLFKCVVGVQGIYDLATFFTGREWTPTMQRAFGADAAALAGRSATSHAATVKARVLLMHQKGDDRVPVEQSSALRSALRAAGNSPQWEMIGSDYSAYFTPQDRAAVYTKIIGFLRKQVGKDD